MTAKRISNSTVRALRVLKALRGHSLDGISNGELAKTLNEPASAITRAMAALIEEGLAIKLDNGRFAPSVSLLQIAVAHSQEMERATGRIAELGQRVAAGSRN
ncbi:IclR family transcriptional regulator [Zobellella denitrificans]|uniref:IclR family transcriptional regulator n=1 Tax=Zobellella denitrificans TaxID=347534 RepID=A0A291HNC9_9GAMM|nr:helix-turn-helix domain-containing protein [Zobellella denitrificans]ATG73655.1 IclR family transcriptional regulator [Zobellella denitrificans]